MNLAGFDKLKKWFGAYLCVYRYDLKHNKTPMTYPKTLVTVFILVGFLISTTVGAQTDRDVLESLLSKTLDSMTTVLNVKSLSAAIAFPDDTYWTKADGISSINPTVKVTVDDVYLIGSVTKTMTSACILQLVDENVLQLDDTLGKWINPTQFINPKIAIRQLLNHTSGIYDVLSNPANQPALLANTSRIWTPEMLIQSFLKAPKFAPGTSWDYSNTNYMLLAMIIKRATGNPFYTELRNRFFTPLTLTTIAIPAFETLNSPVAHVWLDLNGDGVNEDGHDFYINWLSLNSTAGAAGGYFATPKDVSTWMRRYMRGDLLSKEIMTQAKTTVAAPGTPGGRYGLGLMTKNFLGFAGLGHGGDLAYAANSWYFPAKDISITVMTNDAKNNSWTLLPVVQALLKIYNGWGTISSAVDDSSNSIAKCVVYPIPFQNDINISLDMPNTNFQDVDVILTDKLGHNLRYATQKVTSFPENMKMDNLDDLPTGTYYLMILHNGKILATTKLIK